MPDMSAYRVLSRKRLILPFLAVLTLSVLSLWIGIQWLEALSARQSELLAADPGQAALELADSLRFIAAVNAMVLLAGAGLLSRYGVRGIRTESMPPVGSWVIEGQRIRTGPKAVMVARLMVAAAGLLVVVAGAGTGKTLFAIELFRRLAPGYAEGAAFVSLASVTDAAEVLSTMHSWAHEFFADMVSSPAATWTKRLAAAAA